MQEYGGTQVVLPPGPHWAATQVSLLHTSFRPQQLLPQRKLGGHRSFEGMVVVVVVVSVVEVVAIVVDVVLAEPATTATRSSAQFSARPCTVSEVLVL